MHAFHVFATNTPGAHTDLYVTGGDVKLRDGDFRLGFNISRTFTPRRTPPVTMVPPPAAGPGAGSMLGSSDPPLTGGRNPS